MNYQVKKRPSFVKLLGLCVAILLVALCFPFNAVSLIAFASDDVDYTYITIDKLEGSTETISKGSTYTVRDAKIGGNKDCVVGEVAADVQYLQGDGTGAYVTYVSSSVVVSYNGNEVTKKEHTQGATPDPDAITFTADKQGTYTVTYSYTFAVTDDEDVTRTYTNSYDLTVESELSSASISIPDNGDVVLPSIIDLSVDGAKDSDDKYIDVYIPEVEVTDEDGEEIEVAYVANSKNNATDDDKTKDGFVVVSANGGTNTKDVEIKVDDATGALYIDGDIFEDSTYGAGNYTIKFSYYDNDGNFITSTTKTITVYAEDDPYYTDYKLALTLSSTWSDNGQTGVETTLPSATGVTSTSTDPASESVDVVYKVEVQYSSTSSKSNYAALTTDNTADIYYETEGDDAVVYVENGKTYLIDPTSFKPLEDGYYTFIYTITDFYGNTVTTDVGSYEYKDIKDETSPTPVLYDASEYVDGQDYEDASYKFATQHEANSVIIYAIGIDDNVSTAEDADLTRKIMTDETVTKFTIDDYDSYNLIFNFFGGTANATLQQAWSKLLTNNYLVNKQATKYFASYTKSSYTEGNETETNVLDFLKDNGYLIVIDNSNYAVIYNYFSETFAKYADAEEFLTAVSQLSEDDLAPLGFAYVDADTTFGATTSQASVSGMGSGYYYVYYVAEDAAGNSSSTYKRVQIVSGLTDDEIPEITFSTTLASYYVSGSTITFTAPTASDTSDSNMLVKTLYRVLDVNGDALTVTDKDGEEISTENISEVWADISGSSITTYQEYETKYASYNGDGYVDLTDVDASSYSIDLSELDDASKVQIFVYVYDDAGNIAIYGTTVDIANANDKYSPTFRNLEQNNEDESYFEQGETIYLPTLEIADDAVGYVSANVSVKFVTDDTTTDISVTGNYSDRTITNQSAGYGLLSVYGGSFVASYSGTYLATIATKDGAGNMIVAFANYYVNSRDIISEPTISTTFEKSQTLELDKYGVNDTIEIPVPTVTYEIANSVTYDAYLADQSSYDDDSTTTKVVYGVDEDGRPTNYSTTIGQIGYVKPRELGIGEHQLIYTVKLLVYNYHTFAMNESSYTENGYVPGGYLTFVDTSTYTTGVLIYATGEKEFKLVDDDDENTYYTLAYETDDNGDSSWVVRDSGGDVVTDESQYMSTVTDTELGIIEKYITYYLLTSDTYTITIEDTTAPVVKEQDYPTAVAKTTGETQTITIYGIEATDASGIDKESSSIRVSWKLSTGVSSYQNYTGADAFTDNEFDLVTNSSGDTIDGTYTITYTVYDNAGNCDSNTTYTIAVGDNTAPTITVDDDFVDETYEIGSTLKLDLSLISYTDASGVDTSTLTVTLTDSDGDEVEVDLDKSSVDEDGNIEDVEGVLYFDLDAVGTYTITITIDDTVGWTATKSITFEVEAQSSDSTMVYQIVGTVLIVVSVLVLAGVIIYFIVSKVKLDKEMKK